MKIFKLTKLWRGLTVVFALLIAIFAVITGLAFKYEGFVNEFFGLAPPAQSTVADEMVYKSKYGDLTAENCKKLIADENDFNIRAMQEGAVLLRNEDNTLPLAANERRVTFFGNSVADPVYETNCGGASFKASRGGSLHDAFTAAGFAINDTLFNAYGKTKRVSNREQGKSSIGEEGSSFYTDALKNSYANDYNDVAFIMFSRFAGEGVDADTRDADGVPMLSLHKSEKDLVTMVKNSGKFKKIVLLVNSPFPMDLQWIEDSDYGIDACLVFGATGDVGFKGVANLIIGAADPSGRLADTYAADSMSAPAMRNFGDFTYSNHNTQYENKYVVYAEGIYVGYKYYETRYYDQVKKLHNATGNYGVYASSGETWNYAQEMAYTFGYGLSYARFTQELKSLVWDKTAHKVTATVEVECLGVPSGSAYTGKSKKAVQLYVSLPWKEGQAEKPAIQLLGFAKTPEMEKGDRQTVTIEASDYLFATYDSNAVNGADTDKKGCYVFDAGDYFFALGEDAHDALNNVLAKEGVTEGLTDMQGNTVTGNAEMAVSENLAALDNTSYARSTAESAEADKAGEHAVVCNTFQDIDYNYFKPGAITYLTRADWATYPVPYTGLEATDAMKVLLDGNTYVKGDDAPNPKSITVGKDAGLKFYQMHDVDYYDAKWDTFIDQLTYKDLATVIGEKMGNYAITNVGKPDNANHDGPKGISGVYTSGDGSGITCYVDQVTMSQTFNIDLHTERGELFAEDALYSNTAMVFGPGADWHRTPYAGRNSEYYSEDANMSYICGAAQVKAMQKGGLIAAIKHFVANDQETNRHGVSTFSTEQGFRQGSLRCFEGALRDDVGGGLGTMTCFNRVGLVAGAASEAVLVKVLREEWGFKGVNLTDSSKDASAYVHTEECVMGGTDMFNNDTDRTTELLTLCRQDGNILNAMKKINKHYFYAYARSNNINGIDENTEIVEWVPWWQPTLYAFIAVSAVLTAAALTMFILGQYVFGRKNKEEKNEN